MIVLFTCLAVALPLLAAPPMTTLTISVKNSLNKPVDNASVVVRFVKGHSVVKLGTKIRREWELRTDQDGQVTIPPIPQGQIMVQVIAKNYQTFGQSFDVDEEKKTIEIKLNDPQPQYSAH